MAIALISCGGDNPIEKQEERIELYITSKMSKNPNLKLSNEGAVRYLYEPGDTTQAVVVGDSVYFYYLGTLVSDTLMYFDTNVKEFAEALGLDTSHKEFAPTGVVVGHNNLINGLSIGLKMVHPGDVGEIIFNSDYGFGDKKNGLIPENSALIFKTEVVKIRKNQ